MPNIKPYVVIDPTAQVGPYSIIWHFTTIGYGVVIGEYCAIGSNCYIGNHTTIGNESRIQTGVFLPNNTTVGERVFIGPCVTMTDDRYPRVRNARNPAEPMPPYLAEPPIIKDGASIGAGAVILPGVTVGKMAMIGAGAVVVRDVPDNAVIAGIPGKILRINKP